MKIDKTSRAIKPDIVMWDKGTFINDGFFSILWACEIKSSFTNTNFPHDEERMRALLQERAQLTSQLIFIQDKSGANEKVERWFQGNFFRWIIRSER